MCPSTSCLFFFFSSRRRHTRSLCDWSSDVCSSDLKGLRVYGDELCKTALDAVLVRVVPELHREPVGELDLPGQSGAQQHLPGFEGKRNQQTAKGKVALRDLAFAPGGPGEDRQGSVTLFAGKLPMSIHELRPSSLGPEGERYGLFDAHFQAIGPAAPQFGSAHPGNPFEH